MTTETSAEITDPSLAREAEPLVQRLVADRAAGKLAEQDPTLWGPEAEREASVRLSWTTLHETSRGLVAEIDALRAELREEGLSRIVLAGMGGSSLAPEVITATAGTALVVLDTTDPAQVRDALEGELERTVVVVSSKSGTTVETDSHRRVFERAFSEEGLDPARRMIVVTDPGSPLQTLGEESGYRKVFTADPNVGGRYSALSAFGLVPAGLAGADIAGLLDDAESTFPSLRADDESNPAIRLAAALSAAHQSGAEKVVLADSGSGVVGFADWAEQLIAESTGKSGIGLLPVPVENVAAPGFATAGGDATPVAIGPPTDNAAVSTYGSLGGLMLLWEFATALAGRLLGINPFDQPDVEAAKQAARGLLDGPAGGPVATPATVDGSIEVHAEGDWLSAGVGTVTEALRALVSAAPATGYLAVQAYLDRIDDASITVLRPELARRTGLQTTFGWGPRFLHSTGQYHKGGHQNGVFLQVTGAVEEDMEVPGRPYTLSGLQRAQALGDGQVLAQRNRPVLRLHLTDRTTGLVELVKAVQDLRTAG
ncbi:glucose-6-phosphate isomerase [Actinopolyspora xinjiangensis]|uniref:Glucose-6-phosphate isomerase n=1 Tax=Actinopolyspora xinjiangensis TaxID=405564 RepID=A0A1H0WHE0_9ACTN|nr:glucose-6-phosphate isomerase [Actinopolyspora xinjiangensis]SDP89983.1 glucose-6-phosphate isomerase [Actinopolyspora xinjiangensis]